MSLEFHPLANLFPLIEGEAFDALVADIGKNGLIDAIVDLNGKILDGRNRFLACEKAGVKPRFTPFDTLPAAVRQAGPLAFVLAKNLSRRHLDESQRAMIAARLANMRQGERTDLQPSENLPKVDQKTAAQNLHVSDRLLRAAKTVKDKAVPELTALVDAGKLPVSVAATAAKLPEPVQREVVSETMKGRANVVRAVVKKAARADKETRLADKLNALPDKKYGVIYADPEWRFEPRSRETGMDRAADNHYPTSSTDEIAARDVASISADDCVLFLWATAPMLPDALRVMTAWRFTYRTHCIWRKVRQGDARGPGYWFTGEHELLLLGTRGAVPAPAPGSQWRSEIAAEVGAHSEKPAVFRRLIEAYFPTLPKIELNARARCKGWDAWGNEAPPEDGTKDTPPETALHPPKDDFDPVRDMPAYLRKIVEKEAQERANYEKRT